METTTPEPTGLPEPAREPVVEPDARKPRWALMLPVALTVLIGALIGGYVVWENLRQTERIEAADDAGADYLAEVATFRAEIAEAISDADADDPAALRAALTETWDDPPTLPEVDRRYAELSTTYGEAETVAADLLAPYESFEASLRKAERDQAFIQAATDALELDVSDFIPEAIVNSSSRVRQLLIPAFVTARDEFAQVEVPDGAEEAARLTTAALQSVIDGASQLAAAIDDNRNYTFTYGTTRNDAAQALGDFEARAGGDFTEAVNAINDLAKTPD